MFKYIKSGFIYLCIATTLNVFAKYIKSDFITNFPGSDFLTIMLTLLAINIATSSYIISKLEEMSAGTIFSFTKAQDAIKDAIKEQIVLVVFAFIVLMARSSEYLINKDYVYHAKYLQIAFVINILLTAIFTSVIVILWDTGKSIFSLVRPKIKRD